MHLPSSFKHHLQHLKQHHSQRLDQDDYLPPHISLNSNNSNLNLLNNNEASNLLFKELHKLVSGSSNSHKPIGSFTDANNNYKDHSQNNNTNHHNPQLDPLIRHNSANNNNINNNVTNGLSRKLLSIRPHNTNLTNNQILQLRSDELDRVKTNVSSSSNQTKANTSNTSSLMHLTDFLKNTTSRTKGGGSDLIDPLGIFVVN